MKEKGFTTQVVHAERLQNIESGAVHQPLHQSVLFAYEQAQDLVNVFQGKSKHHAYARQSTPSVNVLQNTLTQLEGAVSSLVFSSGMAALSNTLLTLLKAGDHLIMSQFVFGNTSSFAKTLIQFGIEVDFVDITNHTQIKQSIKPNTRMLFCETIANPVTQVADIKAIKNICQPQNIVLTVDNTMTPCYLFNGIQAGADLLICSLTKYFGGHANALGGAVIDTGNYNWQNYPNILKTYQQGDSKTWAITQIKKKGLRDMGACLSSDAIHLLSVGAETLALRMDKSCHSALQIATFLNQHHKIKTVYYPGLATHPEHAIAQRQFKYPGAILSFDLIDSIDCLDFIDQLKLILCSTHLGDNRSLAIPVAPTIYYEMGIENRKKMGISEGMIRLSVGIEDTQDIINDLTQALSFFN
ncbi:cystathionine gamma-synthase family protein [Catenovulum adriaticum]|uniref:Cystathionine gamma-synthase family protein n=2 Tax=Catenovulum adriaticum TaxID=2984846 RepID=A0ABY7APY9_9ALTE|nr:cystathionine gamma-synthase family protein [Catenovulum sp. TS8]